MTNKTISEKGSVSHWLSDLRAGDEEAAQQLWQRYFDRVVHLARERLGDLPRRVTDEEDVALSVFRCLCDGATRGQFAGLSNRNELWRLLMTLTAHKVIDRGRAARQQKRGAGQVRGDSVWAHTDGAHPLPLEQVIGNEPTPEFLAIMVEEHQRLLDLLDDSTLQRIAFWRMEGWSNQEMASKLGLTRRSVERKLQRIRIIWAAELKLSARRQAPR